MTARPGFGHPAGPGGADVRGELAARCRHRSAVGRDAFFRQSARSYSPAAGRRRGDRRRCGRARRSGRRHHPDPHRPHPHELGRAPARPRSASASTTADQLGGEFRSARRPVPRRALRLPGAAITWRRPKPSSCRTTARASRSRGGISSISSPARGSAGRCRSPTAARSPVRNSAGWSARSAPWRGRASPRSPRCATTRPICGRSGRSPRRAGPRAECGGGPCGAGPAGARSGERAGFRRSRLCPLPVGRSRRRGGRFRACRHAQPALVAADRLSRDPARSSAAISTRPRRCSARPRRSMPTISSFTRAAA